MMLDRIWSGESRLYWLLLPLSLLYGAITTLRRTAYRCGLFSSWLAPVPIIMIGNLNTGGSGKTPLVIWLVTQLQARGMRVGVVARGYGGKSSYYPLVLDNSTSSTQAGDEPVLIFQRTQAPVAVAPRRRQAVEALLQQYALDVIVTDDGLQHYALQRDMELVVIDGHRRLGNGWWLPAGPLRERAGRLKSVDAVIINGGQAGAGEIEMSLKAGNAVNLLTGAQQPVILLPQVVAMAGIGYPKRFFNALAQQGVSIKRTYTFPDHHNYQQQELTGLAEGAESLLMTEKDAVKCHQFAQYNWWYLPVEAELEAEQLIERIIQLVK